MRQFAGFFIRTLIGSLSLFPASLLAIFTWTFLTFISVLLWKATGNNLLDQYVWQNSELILLIAKFVGVALAMLGAFLLFPTLPGTYGLRVPGRLVLALIAFLIFVGAHEAYVRNIRVTNLVITQKNSQENKASVASFLQENTWLEENEPQLSRRFTEESDCFFLSRPPIEAVALPSESLPGQRNYQAANRIMSEYRAKYSVEKIRVVCMREVHKLSRASP